MGRSRKNTAALLAVRRPGAFWRFLRDQEAPKLPKLGLFLALVYVVMPIDLIPDMAPIITWLDDAGVVALAIGWVASRAAAYEANKPLPVTAS